MDELFASLLGRTFPQDKQAEAVSAKEQPVGGAVDVGSLRIFG